MNWKMITAFVLLMASFSFATNINSCGSYSNLNSQSYVLTADLSYGSVSTCLDFENVTNTVVNCNGHSITCSYNASFGVYGTGVEVGSYAASDGLQIENCHVVSCDYGIDWRGGSNGLIYNNILSGIPAHSTSDGVLRVVAIGGTSDGNLIMSNKITQNNAGKDISAGGANTYLLNNITGSVWFSESGGYFNNSVYGNIYYNAAGTPSWNLFNITSSSGNGWSDTGSDLPFTHSTVSSYWVGTDGDYKPYSLNFPPASYLDYCELNATNQAITWKAYDVLTGSPIPFNVISNVQQIVNNTVQLNSFTGSANSSSNFSICVFPYSGSVQAQLTDTISSVGYSPLTITRYPSAYSGSVSTYNVYLSNNNQSKLVQILVVDSSYKPILNTSVKIQQVSPTDGSIITIGTFITDEFGTTTQALQPATQIYKFSVYNQNGSSLLQAFPNTGISCQSTSLLCQQYLVVNINNVLPAFIRNSFTGSCNYNNGTLTISCNANDASNTLTNYTLAAYTVGNQTLDCYDSAAGSSASLNCVLPATCGTFSYAFVGTDGTNFYTLSSDSITANACGQQSFFGRNGWFAMLMLFGTIALIGYYSIPVAMMLGVFSLFLGMFLSIVPWSMGVPALIFAVSAVVINLRAKV